MAVRHPAVSAPPSVLYYLAALLPLAVAALLTWLLPPPPLLFGPAADVPLTKIRVSTVPALETVFANHAYTWPPETTVPRLAIAALPGTLDALPAGAKKTLFLRALLPLVLARSEERRVGER